MSTNSTLVPPGAQRIAVERPMVALIAEDPEARTRLAALLSDPSFSLLPVAGAAACHAAAPAAAVLALGSTERDGVGLVRRLRGALGDAPLIVVATPARDHDVRLILAAGAQGLVVEADAARRPPPRPARGPGGPALHPPRRVASRRPRRALAPREGDPRARRRGRDEPPGRGRAVPDREHHQEPPRLGVRQARRPLEGRGGDRPRGDGGMNIRATVVATVLGTVCLQLIVPRAGAPPS